MIIEKTFVTLSYNKHGELVETSQPQKIHVEVEIKTELNKMCQDLLDLLKEDDVFSFSLTHVSTGWVDAKIKKSFFDLEYIEKIVFDEYFLTIDGWKLFYNAIFNFNKEKRW